VLDEAGPPAALRRLADGHIGLASHRVRVESAGGRLELDTVPGGGIPLSRCLAR
jgi:two-component system NarL family sensor kinase